MVEPILKNQEIFFILTLVNFLFFLLIKGEKRYFLGQGILLGIALFTFLVFRIIVLPQVIKSIDYEKSKSEKMSNVDLTSQHWRKEATLYSYNRPTLEFVTFQVTLTFIFSLLGFSRTANKKFFRKTSFLFGFLTLIFIFIYLFVSIIPYGLVT